MSKTFICQIRAPYILPMQKGLFGLWNGNNDYNVVIESVKEFITGIDSAFNTNWPSNAYFSMHNVTACTIYKSGTFVKSNTTSEACSLLGGRANNHTFGTRVRTVNIPHGYQPNELATCDWSAPVRYRDQMFCGNAIKSDAQNIILREGQGLSLTYKNSPSVASTFYAPARLGTWTIVAMIKETTSSATFRYVITTNSPEDLLDDSMTTLFNPSGSGKVYEILSLNVMPNSNGVQVDGGNASKRYARFSTYRLGEEVPIVKNDTNDDVPAGVVLVQNGVVMQDYCFYDGGIPAEQGFQADIAITGQNRIGSFGFFGTASSQNGEKGFSVPATGGFGVYLPPSNVPRQFKKIVVPPKTGFGCQQISAGNYPNCIGIDYEIIFTVSRINQMRSKISVG